MKNVIHLNASRQKGAVLLVSLMILLVLTLLTLVAMSGSTMQERIAGSTRSLDLSLQAAESALREAEADIGGIGVVSSITGMPNVRPTGWYSYINDKTALDALYAEVRTDGPKPSAWDSGTATYAVGADDIGIARISDNPPQYFVEAMPPVPDAGGSLEAGATLPGVTMYRITALGRSSPFDGANAAPYSVILQSTFHR